MAPPQLEVVERVRKTAPKGAVFYHLITETYAVSYGRKLMGDVDFTRGRKTGVGDGNGRRPRCTYSHFQHSGAVHARPKMERKRPE
jgi:hypothetical protein